MENNQNFFESFKKHRESKNISVKDIVEHTKIDPKYINAIECGDFSIAPNVYVRLFIKSYCEFLDLDYKKALDDYEIYTTGKVEEKIDMTPIRDSVGGLDQSRNSQTDDLSSEFNSKSLIGILGIIVVVIILLIFINNVKESSLDTPTQTMQLPESDSTPGNINPDAILNEPDKPFPLPVDSTKFSS